MPIPFDQARLPSLLIRNRNFLLLWAAYGISAIGDHLSELAILDICGGMERRDTTRLQALMQFGFFAPFVLFAPLAGWWADRFSRKWTMFASDILRGIVMLNLVWAVPYLWNNGYGDLAAVLPLGMAGLLAVFFSPARQALLPTLIRDDQLVRGNAMIGAMGTIGAILSAVIGGYLVASVGPFWNFKLDAVTFGVSAFCVLCIQMSRSRFVPRPPQPGMLAPFVAGFRYVMTHSRVFQMILLGTVFWAAAGAITSMIPALVRDIFGGDISDAGLYRGLVGVGLIGGAVLMTIFGAALPIPLAVLGTVFGVATWVALLDVAVIFQLGRIAAGVCLVMIGLHGSALLVTIMSTIQRFVPDSRRGRVFGVSDMLTMAAMTAASAALGLPRIPNIDTWIPYLLAVTAIGIFAAGVVALRIYLRANRREGPLLTVLRRLVRFYAEFWCRLKRAGPCTIPTRGPAILAANHAAGIDPLLIISTSPHRVPRFVVERQYYSAPLWGWFIRLIRCIPVNRAQPGPSTLAECLRGLAAGDVVGIFPQGTFEKPGDAPLEARIGIGLLALKSGAPVIPVHLSGQAYSESPFGALFRRHRAVVRYGKPVDLRDLAPRARERETQQRAAERIMAAVRALGQDVVSQIERVRLGRRA